MAETLNSRLAAHRCLMDVLQDGALLDAAFEAQAATLSQQNRAFARMLCATTLRRMGQIDAVLRDISSQSGKIKPLKLLLALRLGAAQALFMDVAPHAAVDTTVQLAQKLGLNRQKGFVNAVMRKLTAEAQAVLQAHRDETVNIPGWLMKAWTKDYGEDAARGIALASLTEAPLDITLKPELDVAEWAETLGGTAIGGPSVRLLKPTDVTALPGYAEGRWWVQDAAAAHVAPLLGDVKGKIIIDVCAAPGGKTAQLAAAGAHVLAVDISENRMKRLTENMQRLGLQDNVTPIIADALTWQPNQSVDGILLDAPCSATGTIRRHPDLLHIKTKEDIQSLLPLQTQMLSHAASLLKPGQPLVYATCSLQKAEGEAQIAAFLDTHPHFKPEEEQRLLPGQNGDGFYKARLRA